MAFDAGRAIQFGVTSVRRRPRAAAVLLAWDGTTAAAIALSLAYIGATGASPSAMAWIGGLLTVLIAVRRVVSAAAWLRFFAGIDDDSWTPFRLGKDELRLALINILVAIAAGVFALPAAFGLFALHELGAPAALLAVLGLAAIPLVFWVVAFLGPAGALTILRGDLGALDTRVIPGHERRAMAWAYAAAALAALLLHLSVAGAMIGAGAAPDFESVGVWIDRAYDFDLQQPLKAAEFAFLGLLAVAASLGWIFWRGVSVQAAVRLNEAGETSRPASSPAPDRAPEAV